MNTDIELPWRKSRSDNVYCRLNDVPSEIKSNLIVEDNSVVEIGEFSYKVRMFDDNVLVFRERRGENKTVSYCKICAQSGFPNIPIKWQNVNRRWVPHNYDVPSEPHVHLHPGNGEYEEVKPK